MLPGNSADPQAYGKVMSIGPDVPKYETMPEKNIKVGHILVMHMNAGMDMLMERSMLRTVKYDEVYGILTDKEFMENLEELVIPDKVEEIAEPLIHTIVS